MNQQLSTAVILLLIIASIVALELQTNSDDNAIQLTNGVAYQDVLVVGASKMYYFDSFQDTATFAITATSQDVEVYVRKVVPPTTTTFNYYQSKLPAQISFFVGTTPRIYLMLKSNTTSWSSTTQVTITATTSDTVAKLIKIVVASVLGGLGACVVCCLVVILCCCCCCCMGRGEKRTVIVQQVPASPSVIVVNNSRPEPYAPQYDTTPLMHSNPNAPPYYTH